MLEIEINGTRSEKKNLERSEGWEIDRSPYDRHTILIKCQYTDKWLE